MIISGYQGIGKSSLAGRNGVIDLESGSFWHDGARPADWYVYYVNIAEHLSAQGYTVFVASHGAVRERLAQLAEDVYVIFPSLSLEDKWVEKLEIRYEESGLDKDYKAWRNAAECYKDNIAELADCGLIPVEIDSMDYDLEQIVLSL